MKTIRFLSLVAMAIPLPFAGTPAQDRASAPSDEAKTELVESPRHQEWIRVEHDGRQVSAFLVFPAVDHKAKCLLAVSPATTAQVLNIGSRLELFVDSTLIERMEGVDVMLHHPQPAPPSQSPPSDGHYATVIKDGDVYRLY
ncbi:MAG: hypothetical protein WBW88_08345, partial [Rhodothermales bacterium]